MVLQVCGEFIGDKDVAFSVGWVCWNVCMQPPHLSFKLVLYCAGLYGLLIFFYIYILRRCHIIRLRRPICLGGLYGCHGVLCRVTRTNEGGRPVVCG